MSAESVGEGLALIGPFEGQGHGQVGVVDEGQDAGGQIRDRGETGTPEQLAGETVRSPCSARLNASW